MKFKELNLDEQLLEAISYMGFEEATPIQEQIIPEIIKGRDVIACAQTGTGKTAAFVLPVLQNLLQNPSDHVSTLIIVPTRELAIQIDQQIQALTYFSSIASIAIYGGGDGSEWNNQKRALTLGNNIIVATPGKLISHLNMGYVKFEKVRNFVLDEADRMLDMNFFDDINKIASFLPKNHQTSMFSATMSPKIKQLAKKILKDPVEVILELSKPAEGVLQAAYSVRDDQKIPLIKSLIIDKPNLNSVLIFTSTKKKVSEIVHDLKKDKIPAKGISSNLEQAEREEVLLDFRAKNIKVLVATDVLSRGIDIKEISLVINYDVPNDAEDYVHRVGRTARAKTTGVAITLVNKKDERKFKMIEELIERKINRIPFII